MDRNNPAAGAPPAVTESPSAIATARTDFEALLHDLDGGTLLEKISRAFSDACTGAAAHGKKGQVVLTFDFARIGESMQVECDHTVKAVVPTARGKIIDEDSTSTPLYVSGRGRLTLMPVATQPGLFAPRD